MKAHGKPKIARAPKGQAKEEPNERRGQQASPLLAAVPEVNQSEGTRQNQRSRPETDPARQRELGVAAQEKLLEQSHQQKHYSPEGGEPGEACSVQHDVTEGERVRAVKREHQQADRGESP